MMRVCPSCFALYGPDQQRCNKDGTPTEDSVEVLIGRSLGPHKVRSLIGEGGMGVVYAGEHTTIGRRVALKVLRPELSLRDDIVERFVQEARSVNTISHANIVNIYDFGKTPFGSFYIVMEYLEGRTVRALIDEQGQQPLERAEQVIRGVGAALAAAHAKGFIHRDVKPENIIFNARPGIPQIKLLDFGIAKLLTVDGTSQQTQTGSALGTPQYMSPEQLEEMSVDHRADIYALGVVAYEMLTARLPFPGKSHAEVRQLQLTQTPPPPSVLNPQAGLSRKLDAAILWTLNPDPERRCPNVESFVEHFCAGAHEDSVPEVRAPGAPPVRRPRLLVAVVVALAAMLTGAAVVFLVLPDKKQTGQPAAGQQRDASAAGTDVASTHAHGSKTALDSVVDALSSKRATTRVLVTELLAQAQLVIPALEPHLVQLVQRAKHPAVRSQAARALVPTRSAAARKALRRVLARPTITGQPAWDLAESLALMGDPAGRQRLRTDLARARSRPGGQLARKAIIKALGRLKDPLARRGLNELLKHAPMQSEPALKLSGCLAAIGDRNQLKKLKQTASTDEWHTRVAAAVALAAADRDTATRVLTHALERADAPTRLAAATELARFQDVTALKTLLEFLKSLQENQRRDSALALGHLAVKDVRGALTAARNDPAESVRLAAAIALLAHSGGK